MKLSNIHQKNSKGKSKSKKRIEIIEEPNNKNKSESKERFNTISDIRNKSKKRIDKKIKENYYDNLSKKKEVLLKINPEKNDKESYPYNIRTKKINKNKENKVYKDYPNLIKGVLSQAVYNNMTNNINYNEYIRYKPISDIFNDQSNIPTRKITTENNNSLNISFYSKSDLVKKEKEKNEIENNLYNNNFNIENELKINIDSIKSKKNETLVKSGKSISPILPNNNENKKESNKELVSEYINIKSNEKKLNKELGNVEIYPKNIIEIEKIDNFNIIMNENKLLKFKNDKEIWKYIRNKMSEEKEKEYELDKIKYNYFTLIKKFHGKILYEIDLENNLKEINSILEKENVKVENEPILLITKKLYDSLNTNINSEDEIKLLNLKNNEINKENATLKNNINIMKEETYKLRETINILNEKLKLVESEINEKDNKIEEYTKKLSEYNIKNEKDKENHILEIIKNDYFDIININKNKIEEKNIIYLIEHFEHQYKTIIKKEENKEITKKVKDKIIKANIDKVNNNNKLDKKEEKKDSSNKIKDKIDIFNKNKNNENNIKKEENIPNKIFLVNNLKKEETKEEKMRREERMNKALKRIKNKRKIDEEKEKIKKSEKVKEISSSLETQLQKEEGKKLYIDLEYEKEMNKEKD